VALAAAIWRKILVGRNFQNAPIAVLLSLFALANLVDHLAARLVALDGCGIRLALSVAALLVALVGGRVTPSFTRNWMARTGLAPLPAPMDHLDRLALAVTAIALVGWIVAPDQTPVGAGLLTAGVLLVARLLRWHGYRAAREPIVLILHLGYLWLAVALLLLGLAVLAPSVMPISAAIHALTAGAIGTMTLAVMTRATRGHTGRTITADAVTNVIYILVTLGALLRVAAPLLEALYSYALIAGGVAWSGAFLLFACAYAPMLFRKRLSG
jgi:uncharacterized protein involved in response to NO